jgi:hypothetical protein
VFAFVHALLDRLGEQHELMLLAETNTPTARYTSHAHAFHRAHLAAPSSGRPRPISPHFRPMSSSPPALISERGALHLSQPHEFLVNIMPLRTAEVAVIEKHITATHGRDPFCLDLFLTFGPPPDGPTPRHWFHFAHVCDAPAQIPTTREELIHTARFERLFPGEGGIDIHGILGALPATIPYALEIPRATLAAQLGEKECARLAIHAARQNHFHPQWTTV